MANQFFYVSGVAEWAQVKRPNKFGNWAIQVYTDKATRKQLKDIGLRVNPREGNEEYGDGWYLTFRRPTTKVWKGVKTELTPPVVLNADGTAYEGLIGNGSKVTVKIEIYDFNGGVDAAGVKYDGGKGTRLESVRIDALVEYKPENETGTGEIQQAAAGKAVNAPGMGLPF